MAVYLGKQKVGPIITVVTDEDIINLAYVKQMDMLDSISGITKINENDYTSEEMQRLEKILINLTEDQDG